MKITELQIGDYVRINHTKEIVWVFEIDGDRKVINNESDGYCSEKNINIDDVEPIPITAEILEKNGFVFMTGLWYLTTKERKPIQIVFKDNNVITLSINATPVPIGLKYVHQLQHALRLYELSELADNLKLEE